MLAGRSAYFCSLSLHEVVIFKKLSRSEEKQIKSSYFLTYMSSGKCDRVVCENLGGVIEVGLLKRENRFQPALSVAVKGYQSLNRQTYLLCDKSVTVATLPLTTPIII